jgi:hypothetical protein
MGQLTAKQTHDLANDFLVMASAIGDYRYREITNLNADENLRLKELHNALLDTADELYTRSANLVMDEVEASLNHINNITQKIHDAFQKIADVQQAIDRATQLVRLGTAVLTSDPLAIKDTLTTIIANEELS